MGETEEREDKRDALVEGRMRQEVVGKRQIERVEKENGKYKRRIRSAREDERREE